MTDTHHDHAVADDHAVANGAADPAPEQISPAAYEAAEQIYWRSYAQLADTPEFREAMHREFPEGASEPPTGFSRRGFMGLLGASMALAGLTSCRKPAQKILPFAKRPDGFSPGVPDYYATAFVAGGYGTGILVKSYDGRPIKIEGNREHPSSRGGTTATMQADLLNLYDPARSKSPRRKGAEGHGAAANEGHGGGGHGKATGPTWNDFRDWALPHFRQLAEKQGEGLRFLLEATSSPTMEAMLRRVAQAFPKAKVHTWLPVHRDAEVEGTTLAFGKPLDVHYRFTDEQERMLARVVASFDCDFLNLHVASVANARAWSDTRRIREPADEISRLYVCEASYSTTGAMADHRFRARAQDIGVALRQLAVELAKHGVRVPGAGEAAGDAGKFLYHDQPWIPVLAKDLAENRGRCAVLVGPRQPAAVQALGHAINVALGNVGTTVTFTETPALLARSQVQSIGELAADMEAGVVDTLVCLGTNPVYTAPADLQFEQRLAKVPNTVHLGLYCDETGQRCSWHLNMAHDLEAWGDVRSYDGAVTFLQPLIAPLYAGRTSLEVLAGLLDLPKQTAYDLVRENWQALMPSAAEGFDAWWNQALYHGLVAGTALEQITPELRPEAAAAIASITAAGSDGALEVLFQQDPALYDGRFSNNPWMMELPDPITKQVWDNAALLSPLTAERLGIETQDVLEVALDGRSLEVPALIVPGHADDSMTLTLGYGRRLASEHTVAHGAGFDAYRLRTSKSQYLGAGARVRKTGATYVIALTQEHGTMEGRAIVREASLATFRQNPTFAPDMSPLARGAAIESAATGEKVTERDRLKSLWHGRDRDYSKGQQWAMVIDLNTCIGCNACITACDAENNVPMVGKEQVRRNREMHWLRVDRYFSGRKAGLTQRPDVEAEVVFQPLPCMHCENAPCESVCPVAATTHSPDGLNEMTYNRCIGTRYCSNNCPYKVRRFNWFRFDDLPTTYKMQRNPDVTVRSRGVMEKCSFCLQRINAAKLQARLEGRPVRDGDVTTACAQACPTRTIWFGDRNDAQAMVAKLKAKPLNYELLSELNTRPRTSYLARVRNPNPDLRKPSHLAVK